MTKLVLSEGHISPDSPISVELIKNHRPDAHPTVVIHWPAHVTQCSGAQLPQGRNSPGSLLIKKGLTAVPRSTFKSVDHDQSAASEEVTIGPPAALTVRPPN
jgi:hypothetical protein